MMGWDKGIFHGSVTNNCDPTKLKDAIIVDKAVEETMTLALVTVSHCARRNSRSDRFESTPKIRQHFVFSLFQLFFFCEIRRTVGSLPILPLPVKEWWDKKHEDHAKFQAS